MRFELFLPLLLWAGGCFSVPQLNGRALSTYSPGELQAAAQDFFGQGDFSRAGELAEFVVRTGFDYPHLEEVFFLAGESRFQNQQFDRAFRHYRRLLEQYPYSRHAPWISRRVWAIGKKLVRQEGRWFGDQSALHDVGVEALNLLVTHFPKSSYADDAWKELARAFARDHQYQAVVDIYERLLRDHPDSEWADLAMYKVSGAYRAQSRGSAFDVDPLLRAHAALERYLRVFPDGNFVVAARQDLQDLEGDVARHELAIAEFYRKRGDAAGRRIHLSNAALRFPGAGPAKEALSALRDLNALPGKNSADLLEPRQDRPPWRRRRVESKGASQEDSRQR